MKTSQELLEENLKRQQNPLYQGTLLYPEEYNKNKELRSTALRFYDRLPRYNQYNTHGTLIRASVSQQRALSIHKGEKSLEQAKKETD